MHKLNKKKVKSAVPGSMGIQAVIAQKCGVTRAAVTIFLSKEVNQDIKKLIEDEKEKVIDVGEKKLIELVNAGEFQAVKFLLTTKGKNRGYTERQEIEHFGDNHFKIEFGEPVSKDDIHSEDKTD